jgi:hypothetical protein
VSTAVALDAFGGILTRFRSCLTAPTFVRFVILTAGWILTSDPSQANCVTQALISAQVSGRLHWEAFHRVFSRNRWDIDRLGRVLFELLLPLVGSVFEVAIDDTLAPKKGIRVFGVSMHVDAVSSTKKHKNLVNGHCWVQLGLVINVPWSKRPWFVPLLSRLYRGKKEAATAKAYRTKSALAREMLDLFLSWLRPGRKVHLLIDSGYMGRTMLRGLPLSTVTVFGSIKSNAALYRPVEGRSNKRRGRPRKKGTRLLTPAKMHHSKRTRWETIKVQGPQERTKQVLSLKAQWYGVLGAWLNHVVLIREDEKKLRVVLCTDQNLSAEQIVTQGARRWPIEVWNREVKQFFGFADSPATSKQAVLRTAPWVALLSGVLVVWFHRVYEQGMKVPLPERPWYFWKEDLSFADLLRAAQQTLRGVDILDWAVGILGSDLKVFHKATEEKNAARFPGAEAKQIA